MSFLVAVLPHLNIQMRKLQPQSFVKSNNAALLLTMFLFCNSCNPPETRDLSCPHLWPPSHHDKSSEYNCHVTVPHVPAPMVPIVTAAWRHVPTTMTMMTMFPVTWWHIDTWPHGENRGITPDPGTLKPCHVHVCIKITHFFLFPP